jgi:hypothetical protein
MVGQRGNRIIVESERVGQVEREGEILEVIQSQVSVRYRVRWNDGHESLLTPAGGSVRILPAEGTSTGEQGGGGAKGEGTKKKDDKAKKAGKKSKSS